MKIFGYLITFFLSSVALNPKFFLENITSSNSDLVHGIQFIFDNFYYKYYKTTYIVSALESNKDPQTSDLKNAIMANRKNNGINYVITNENHSHVRISQKIKRNCMVFLLDNFQSFEKIQEILAPNRFYLHGFYLFVLTKGSFEEDEMMNMTSSIWMRRISNFNIIYEADEGVNFSIIRPFSKKSCSDVNLITVNLLKDGKFLSDTRSILFPPEKFNNLHGCPLRFVTFERCPAMCYNNKTKKFSGYDYEIIQVFQQILNFQMNLTYLVGSEQWGTILPNDSTTGGLDFLRKGNADIGVGNYFLRLSRIKFFDTTVSYYSIPIALVIPPPEKFSSFEKLLRPFERIIWILLGIIFAVGLLTIFIINWKLKQLKNFVYGRNVKSPTMNMLTAIFGLQQNVLPSRNFARFILMIFLLFCLVNRNVYQGALYLILKSDGHKKEIQSIQEMLDKDFKFYVYATYVDFVNEASKIYQRKIVIQSEAELPYSREVDETLKAAFMTPLTNVMNRNEMSRGKFSLRVCKEQVSVMSIVMYMQKGFYLKDTFNDLLLNFDAIGLLSHWYERYAQKRYLNTKTGSSGPKKMNMEHLFGIFNVLLIGEGIAILIFIFEILISKIKTLNTLRKQLIRPSNKVQDVPQQN